MTIKLKLTLFAGFFLLLFFASAVYLWRVFPPINDVTTNLQKPPDFFALQAESGVDPSTMVYPDRFRDIQRKRFPYLAPVVFAMNPESLYAAALGVARNDMGWTIVAEDQGQFRFQAIATTPTLHHKDDVVVSISGDEKQSVLDIRSRSRGGNSDLGAHHERIKAFIKALPSP